jgi:hypothetical protein
MQRSSVTDSAATAAEAMSMGSNPKLGRAFAEALGRKDFVGCACSAQDFVPDSLFTRSTGAGGSHPGFRGCEGHHARQPAQRVIVELPLAGQSGDSLPDQHDCEDQQQSRHYGGVVVGQPGAPASEDLGGAPAHREVDEHWTEDRGTSEQHVDDDRARLAAPTA